MIVLDTSKIIFLIATFFGIYTSLFFLLTVLENWNAATTKSAPSRFPKVCIIVPCFNEERTVGKTIRSLLALDYPKTMLEIIVVDDGSKDGTYTAAKKLAASYLGIVKVFRKPNGGKFTALNYALKRTDAEIVGALDADSTVATDALKKILARFDLDAAKPQVMAVTPSMIIDNPHGVLRRIQSIEFIMGVMLRRVFADIGSQHVTPGPFTLYRKEFFERYGYYSHAHNTEDIEVALRIQTNNYQIENATDAYVYTHGPATFKSLYKQRLRWYSGFIRNIFDYRHLMSPMHGNLGLFVLPTSFLSVFLLIVVIVYTLYSLLRTVALWIYHYWLIGFDVSHLFEFKVDLFFINTNETLVLGGLALILSAALIVLAIRYAKARNVLWSYILFMFLYAWLFAFWWGVAAVYCLQGRKIGWGHKSEDATGQKNAANGQFPPV